MSVGYRAIKANALPMVALWLLAATPDAAGHAAFGEPVCAPLFRAARCSAPAVDLQRSLMHLDAKDPFLR